MTKRKIFLVPISIVLMACVAFVAIAFGLGIILSSNQMTAEAATLDQFNSDKPSYGFTIDENYQPIYIIYNQDSIEILNFLYENNVFIEYEYIKPIYTFDGVKKSSFQNILFTLEILLLVIANLSLFLFCYLNVNNKMKEICVLKSLGIENMKISNIFFIQNLMQTIFSCLLGTVLGVASLFLINNILKGPDLFNIDYNLLIIEPLSYIIVISSAIIFALIATILPYIKISKTEIAVAIKDSANNN